MKKTKYDVGDIIWIETPKYEDATYKDCSDYCGPAKILKVDDDYIFNFPYRVLYAIYPPHAIEWGWSDREDFIKEKWIKYKTND